MKIALILLFLISMNAFIKTKVVISNWKLSIGKRQIQSESKKRRAKNNGHIGPKPELAYIESKISSDDDLPPLEESEVEKILESDDSEIEQILKGYEDYATPVSTKAEFKQNIPIANDEEDNPDDGLSTTKIEKTEKRERRKIKKQKKIINKGIVMKAIGVYKAITEPEIPEDLKAGFVDKMTGFIEGFKDVYSMLSECWDAGKAVYNLVVYLTQQTYSKEKIEELKAESTEFTKKKDEYKENWKAYRRMNKAKDVIVTELKGGKAKRLWQSIKKWSFKPFNWIGEKFKKAKEYFSNLPGIKQAREGLAKLNDFIENSAFGKFYIAIKSVLKCIFSFNLDILKIGIEIGTLIVFPPLGMIIAIFSISYNFIMFTKYFVRIIRGKVNFEIKDGYIILGRCLGYLTKTILAIVGLN